MIRGDVTVRVVYDNFPKIRRDLIAEAERIVATAALNLQAATQRNIVAHGLVDTGALLNSVRAERIGPMAWRVVVGAEYGIYHELGTRFLPARPFLFPAADLIRPAFLSAMAGIVRGAG